jgi:alkylated DNA repair dioxygenase AlkB
MTTLLQTGAIWIEEGFLASADAVYEALTHSIAWDERLRARKAASFGSPYNYSGINWPTAPFPDLLVPILERVAIRLGYRPNNCLAHFYPTGDSTMGFHADATDELVPETGIAVVSLGSGRTITFRHQHDRQRLEDYLLKNGSLLYMSPAMQQEWKHAILPSASAGGRISLTFRCMQSA